MIVCNSYISIFSPPISSQLCYVSKVLDSSVADQPLEDELNHVIPIDTKYIKGHYLELIKNNKKKMFHKLMEKYMFTFPARVKSPMVLMKDNFSMSISECQYFSDIT